MFATKPAAKAATAKKPAAKAAGRGRKREAAEITEGDDEEEEAPAAKVTAAAVEAKIEAKGTY